MVLCVFFLICTIYSHLQILHKSRPGCLAWRNGGRSPPAPAALISRLERKNHWDIVSFGECLRWEFWLLFVKKGHICRVMWLDEGKNAAMHDCRNFRLYWKDVWHCSLSFSLVGSHEPHPLCEMRRGKKYTHMISGGARHFETRMGMKLTLGLARRGAWTSDTKRSTTRRWL